MKKFFSAKGFSLTEIMVSVGIAGAIALGAAQLIKNMEGSKASFTSKMNNLTTAKMVEMQLNGKGCLEIIGKAKGDELSVKVGKQSIAANAEIGKSKVSSFTFYDFVPTDSTGNGGIAVIRLVLKEERETRPTHADMMIPVILQGGLINECQKGHLQAAQVIVNKLCEGTYGSFSAGLNCAQVIAKLEFEANKSICKDLYGTKTPQMNGIYCDLTKIHNNETCTGGNFAQKFDANGKVVCAAVPP